MGGLLALALLAGACGREEEPGQRSREPGRGAPQTLRVGLIPNIAPEEQRARYEPFARYLRDRLGIKVELFVATNYAGTVRALEAGQLDLAYLGGLSYVQARERTEVEPLVTEVDRETGEREYLSQIVTRADSGVTKLEDLTGKDFAFGDPSSTSGSLYPRAMLVDARFACSTTTLESCPPLNRVLYTGGHDAAAQAVAKGQVAGAGVEARILHRLQKEGKVPGDLRVLAERKVMGYPWVFPSSIDESFRRRLAEAFEDIRDPALLDLLRAKAYVGVTAEDYEEVEQLARKLGLLNTG
ncbi:MAG: phosphate/phosphite/phosphonate ABC transporter substrate-binding protein [Actinomycetota bacterium]|nr:phosphate/phosphite/phosphonate ABC transporter substrate-binding protein [Actinomycetota bacterium]